MMVVEDKEAGDWSELPNHLLDLIMDGLVHSMTDYIRFGTVCVSWRSAYNIHNPCLLPLLMVPSTFSSFTSSSLENNAQGAKKKKNKKQTELRRFYNILSKKLDDRIKAVRMPKYRQCRGSSHGWLITVDDVEFPIRLFNPFLSSSSSSESEASSSLLCYSSSSLGNSSKEGLEILLPSLEAFPIKSSPLRNYGYSYLRKAILSANPISNPTNYMVMAIYGVTSKLAFVKPGDKYWTPVTLPKIKTSREGYFKDLLYYQGKFFAIHSEGTIVVCDDVATGGMTARVLLQPPKRESGLIMTYLVESPDGNLLQVHRHLKLHLTSFGKPLSPGRAIYTTLGFKVYKLLLLKKAKVHDITGEENYEWVLVKSLGSDAIFLGDNASISISATGYPGCKSNCIYYTDDHCCFYKDRPQDGPQDMGVFNLEDDSFERYYSTDFSNLSVRPIPIWPIPIWIQPSLQKRSS